MVCAANCALEALADSIPSCRFMINQIRLTLNSIVLQRVRHISPSHFYGFCLSKIESLESIVNQSTSLRDQLSLTPRRFPAKQDSLKTKDLHERNRAILKEVKTNKLLVTLELYLSALSPLQHQQSNNQFVKKRKHHKYYTVVVCGKCPISMFFCSYRHDLHVSVSAAFT